MPAPNPLAELHRVHDDAELTDFAGTEIVDTFGEPQAEYAAIRKAAGLIDLPQRGLLELTGRDRHAFLGNLVTNRVYDVATKKGLGAGRGVYAFFLNLKGRVVAEMNVFELGERLLVETDVRHVALLRDTFDKYLFAEQVKLRPLAESHHEFALHGPGAAHLLYDATGVDVELPPLGCRELTLFGGPAVVWRDDPCGVPGLHVVVESSHAPKAYQGLLDAFGDDGDVSNKRRLRRVGWAAFNAGRIENGRPILGIDYEPSPPSLPGRRKDDAPDPPASQGVLPAETGQFERAVDTAKGCYLGQEVVARMFSRNVLARKIVGFRMTEDALPIAGAAVLDDGGNQIGIVTSSTVSPVLSNACVGLMLVKKPHFEAGATVRIAAEGAIRTATVVVGPFI